MGSKQGASEGMRPRSPDARIAFGPFNLDLDRGLLPRDGAPVPLRPKNWALLRHLVESGGRLVTKSELLDVLWPSTSVNEAALANCISQLRAALEDDPRRPRFIEVAHRRGYRWIGVASDA